jgi:hypothetical protein
MVTKTKAVKAVQPTVQTIKTVSFYVSENAHIEHEYQPFNYGIASMFGTSAVQFDNAIIDTLFIGDKAPTWQGYIDSVKASNEARPKADRVKLPTRQSHSALYQRFNNVEKIVEAVAEGFNPLAYWNAKAQTAKRSTYPNISYLLKGAREVLNGAKEEKTPFEKFATKFIAAYKAAGDLPNDKKSQSIVAKMKAIAQAADIVLESENDAENAES